MTAWLGLHQLWLFAVTLLVFNLTPGPDLMFTLARTLQHGVRGGFAAACGIGAGCVVHTLAAAFGLAAVLAASAEAFGALKWAGAAYLAWLAIGLLRAEPAGADMPLPARGVAPLAPHRSGFWPIFRQGLLTNALNPKVAIFFLAFLPQFIDAASPHKSFAFLFLGAWFIVQGIAFLTAFAVVVAPLRRWQAPQRLRRALRAGGGALFLAMAARLAFAEAR